MSKYLIVLVFLLGFISMAHCQTDAHLYREKQEELFRQIFSNPEQASKSLKLLLNDKGKIDDTLVGITWNLLGVYYGVTHQTDSSLYAFDKSLSLFPENYPRIPRILINKAIVFKNKGDLNNAFATLNEALEIAQKQENNKETLARIYGEFASSHRQNNQLNLAITYLLNSIEILETIKDINPEVLAGEKQKLGNTYLETQNYEFAKKLYEESMPVFKEVGNHMNYHITRVNYAECLFQENNKERAIEINLEAYNGLIDLGNMDFVSFAAHRLGVIYHKMNDKVNAERFFKEAYELGVDYKSVRILQTAADYMEFLRSIARYDEAKSIADQTLEFGISSTSPIDHQINFYQILGTILKEQKYFEASLEINEKILALKDTLHSRFDKSTSLDLQAKYQNQLQQQENLILAQKISLQKRNNYILIGFAILCLLITFFIWRFNLLNNRLKNSALEKMDFQARELQAQFNSQKEINLIKEETIEKQKQELLASALEKIQLNEKLETIIQKAENSGENKLYSQLISLKKQDKYWETLISKFYNLHPNFIKNIKKEYPDLSKSEVDFCSLVKMNFSFKEIASILQISHDSVISKKYRITKKMMISGDADFYNVVNQY
jgi:tetratricopeptide (TPR) repeat protein